MKGWKNVGLPKQKALKSPKNKRKNAPPWEKKENSESLPLWKAKIRPDSGASDLKTPPNS